MSTESIVTKDQSKKYGPVEYVEDGQAYRIYANVRYDDECGNGHNTFSITGEIFRLQINRGGRSSFDSCGCLHNDIAKHFPELALFLKWHLMSSDGPMHYVANTTYHASKVPSDQSKWYLYLEDTLIRIVDQEGRQNMVDAYGNKASFKPYHNPLAKEADLEAARRSAIWPDATLEQLKDEAALLERLPDLIAEFRSDMWWLGFEW